MQKGGQRVLQCKLPEAVCISCYSQALAYCCGLKRVCSHVSHECRLLKKNLHAPSVTFLLTETASPSLCYKQSSSVDRCFPLSSIKLFIATILFHLLNCDIRSKFLFKSPFFSDALNQPFCHQPPCYCFSALSVQLSGTAGCRR